MVVAAYILLTSRKISCYLLLPGRSDSNCHTLRKGDHHFITNVHIFQITPVLDSNNFEFTVVVCSPFAVSGAICYCARNVQKRQVKRLRAGTIDMNTTNNNGTHQ